MRALRELLGGILDYAGLFPPAGLRLPAVGDNYRRYAGSADAWMLGRLVLPAAQVGELVELLPGSASGPALSLSVLLGTEPARDWESLQVVLRQAGAKGIALRIDSVELKVDDAAHVQRATAQLPAQLEVFFEVGIGPSMRELIEAVATSGRLAKLRTGAVVAAGIPPLLAVAEFVALCNRERVPFKATAGLHHALRAEYPLSYGADAPRGVMHGFLNLFVGSALLHAGLLDGDDWQRVLADGDGSNFELADESISWQGRRLDLAAISRGRRFARSFGSCSFDEPRQELRDLGWWT